MPRAHRERSPRSARRPRSAYRIRRARPSDMRVLIEHRVAMFREIRPLPAIEFRRHASVYRSWLAARLRDRSALAMVAVDGSGTVVASGCLWWQPSQPRPGMPGRTVPYIFSMFTDPAHRGRGLASALVGRLIGHAQKRRAPRVLLHASEAGRSVYARLGFERTWEMRLWLDPKIARARATAERRAPARRRRRPRVPAR